MIGSTMALEFIEKVKKKLVEFISETGNIVLFFTDSIRLLFQPPHRFGEVIKHMEFIGNQSVGIIALTSLFTGLALSFQIFLGF